METLLKRRQMLKTPKHDSTFFHRFVYRCSMLFDDGNPYNLKRVFFLCVAVPLGFVVLVASLMMLLTAIGLGSNRIYYSDTHSIVDGKLRMSNSSLIAMCVRELPVGCEGANTYLMCHMNNMPGCYVIGFFRVLALFSMIYVVVVPLYFVRHFCFCLSNTRQGIENAMKYNPENPYDK